MARMNSIIKILFISFVFLLVGCKSTKEVVVPNPEIGGDKQEYVKLENALLWKISSNKMNEHNDSYLFGTIHMIEADNYFLPEGTLSALESCKEVVFEIDLDDMNDLGAQMSMMGKVFMKDGVTLSDLLSETDYNLVSDFFKDKGLPMMFVNKIKPLFLSAMTEFDMDSMDMFGGGSGNDASIKSYEMEFYEMANQLDIPSDGLETMDYQLKVFDAIPYETQANMLVDGINSQGDADNSLDELIEAYMAQNIEKLVETIGSEEEFSEFESILLDDRNKNWIPIMKEKMVTQKTFFAVGAGHLAGRNGVIHLLKEEGFILTPILKESMKKI